MKISDLDKSPMLKACSCHIINHKNRLWDINWNTLKNVTSLLKNESGRCYIITSNDEICKIGYSDCKGGIKQTIKSYRDQGNSGSPSDRTHGIHIYIAEELLKGNRVEFYFCLLEPIHQEIILMNGSKTKLLTSISGKFLEEKNKELFKNIEGKYPKWNLQENNDCWPTYVTEGVSRLKEQSLSVTIQEIRERLGLL